MTSSLQYSELCCLVLDKFFQFDYFLFCFVGILHQLVNAIMKRLAAPNPAGSIQRHHKGSRGETYETAKCYNAQWGSIFCGIEHSWTLENTMISNHCWQSRFLHLKACKSRSPSPKTRVNCRQEIWPKTSIFPTGYYGLNTGFLRVKYGLCKTWFFWSWWKYGFSTG